MTGVKKTSELITEISKYWLPVVVWCLVIFGFSSLQIGASSEFYWKDFVIKKSAHLVEYGILSVLFYRALINSKVSEKKSMFYSVFFAFVYGLTDEFHQSFTPGRGPSLRDTLIDMTGAIIFIFGIVNNIKIMPKRIKLIASQLGLILN